MNNRKSIIFLCRENSVLSQIAQALLTERAGEHYDVYSAGIHPKEIAPQVMKVLSNLSIETNELYAKPLSKYADKHFDTAISLCEETQAVCRHYEQSNQQLAWHITDPKSRHQNYAFEHTLQEIDDLISLFISTDLTDNVTLNEKKSSNLLINNTVDASNENTLTIEPSDFYKCLTDDIRLKALMLTHYHGELCVCELMAALDEDSQPKLSRNLAILKKAQLIIARKHGQWMFYRINPTLPQWIKTVIVQTTHHNIPLISGSIKTLKTMTDRPNKNKFCG